MEFRTDKFTSWRRLQSGTVAEAPDILAKDLDMLEESA